MTTKHAFQFALAWLLTVAGTDRSWADSKATGLPRSRPEAQGISSSAILAFVEAAEAQIDALHSFLLVRHGQVVAEGWWSPYDAETPHELYSLSKSFTSTAVGLAIAEGRLSLDDPVISFFPEDVPADPGTYLKAMRVRDLLCMSTGNQAESPTAREVMTPKTFLAQPVPFKPGTHFLYNTPATFMLSAIVQKVSGQTVRDFLQPRLFGPLGMTNPTWETNAQGISLGGYGLSVRTEEIAKFGQLYLQQGQWRGKQLIPTAWVQAATARQTANGSNPKSDWDQGYGYQFWRSRHGAFRGDGAFGQYCIVMPEQDAVVAMTSGVKDMQAVLNLVWDKLLPAMQARRLPVNRARQARLESKLATLTLRAPAGAATSPVVGKLAGRRFAFPPNDLKLEAVALEPGSGGDALTLLTRFNGAEQRVACGHGAWKKGRLAFGPFPERAVAASGAWTADDTFTAKFCYYETPYCLTLTLRFAGDQVFHDAEFNVAFGPTKQPQLVGRAP